MTVTAWVHRMIKLHGSGRKLAAALGVSESLVSAWRHGRMVPMPRTLERAGFSRRWEIYPNKRGRRATIL